MPPSVGGGIGSQFGNYGATVAGEMVDKNGRRCVVFNWDRPLSQNSVLRVRSASCESEERPGWMVGVELERKIIPLSESNLVSEETGP